MHRVVFGLLIALVGSPAIAQKEPITLRNLGSFHVGGRQIEITGQPIKEIVFTPGGVPARIDPNGTYQVEQMYVQYFLPQNRRGRLPLLLWHGGGLTGVTYETKPDGGDGWMHFFLRRGWDVYVSDAMERGRSGWSSTFKGEPVFLPLSDPWERFRIGPAGSWHADPAKRTTYPGMQFPIEAYEQFMKQAVPRWLTTDDAIVAAYVALVEKVCPCVVMVHSQSGSFGFRVAEARPDKIRALVAVEPTLGGDKAKVALLKEMPVLAVYGDNIKDHPRWSRIRKGVDAYTDLLRQAGGRVDVLDLPELGIKGNSHMIMMDRNSDVVAGLIQKWLADRGLAD
ncbi:MAG: esterase [Dehalococcoidia bacterium]|nr:esterase [Dehalococcoidia bacterium]